jgi:hypothetical protein
MTTGSHPSWSNLLHLRFFSGNNLPVRRNVPMFYMDLWPACAHPKIPLHLCHGTKNTRFAWAGGTFFTVVLLCQFLVLVGNRFWFYILMYLEYNTVVVLC